MRLRLIAAACLVVGAATLAHAADPVGHFTVKGTSPGGSDSYEGDVTVTKTGDTYSVIWTIGGTKYVGTGIGNDDFLTVSYKSGNDTGLALYGHGKDGLERHLDLCGRQDARHRDLDGPID